MIAKGEIVFLSEDDMIENLNPDDFSHLAGYSDWRLPTKKGLISIVNYGTYSSSIDTTYFTNTKSSYYWSSTTDAYGSVNVWLVSFRDGYVQYGTTANSSYGNYVRCVRGDSFPTTKSFTDNGNGTVTDNDTNLIWQQGEGSSIIWEDALTYCEGLSLGENDDWRLPNIREMESLTDDTLYDPALDTTYFPDVNSSSYWSSTASVNESSYAWIVYFYNGRVNYGYKPGYIYVRCVRGGQ